MPTNLPPDGGPSCSPNPHGNWIEADRLTEELRFLDACGRHLDCLRGLAATRRARPWTSNETCGALEGLENGIADLLSDFRADLERVEDAQRAVAV